MIQTIAFLFLLFPSSLGRCQPSSAGSEAVLWVPEEAFSDWSAFAQDFTAAGSPGLTLAISPLQLTKARKILEPLIQSGKIDIAFRIDGDPIVPLIASNGQAPRPQDAPDLLSLTRERFDKILGSIPGGYVPGGGAISPDLFGAFKSMSLQWVATGDYPRPEGQWASFSGVVLVPMRAVTIDDLAGFSSPFSFAGWGPIVIDEADGLVPEGSLLGILRQAAAQGIREPWASVSQALAQHQNELTDSSRISRWPTWAGDYSLWNSSGSSQNAWSLYAKAVADLEQYQNSGSADLRSLEEATTQLHRAQASQFYRLVASTQPAQAFAADREFRRTLRMLYQDIDEPSPSVLYQPLVEMSSAAAMAAGDQAQEPLTDVVFDQGPSWISFANPPQSLGYIPASTGPAIMSQDSPWKILGLRVDWSSSTVDLTYQMQTTIDTTVPAAQPFDRLVIDTYIDINHIAGAGSTQLLSGRNAYTEVADAWEYAVSLDSAAAFIYRFSLDGPPQLLAQLQVQSDPGKSALTLSVPQYLMPGDPRRWGYITLSMAAAQGQAGQEPPALWSNPDSSVVLSLLAPLENQESFFADPLLARLEALRAPSKKGALGL